MDTIRAVSQTYVSIIGAAIGWFWGSGSPLLYVLCAFMIIDYISGVMIAIVSKGLSSAIGARGIFKKILILAFVGISHVIDAYVIGSGQTFQTAIIFFYLSNEGISIVENATTLGLPVPAKLKNLLKQIDDPENSNDK